MRGRRRCGARPGRLDVQAFMCKALIEHVRMQGTIAHVRTNPYTAAPDPTTPDLQHTTPDLPHTTSDLPHTTSDLQHSTPRSPTRPTIFSRSALLLGSIAILITGSGKSMRSRTIGCFSSQRVSPVTTSCGGGVAVGVGVGLGFDQLGWLWFGLVLRLTMFWVLMFVVGWGEGE